MKSSVACLVMGAVLIFLSAACDNSSSPGGQSRDDKDSGASEQYGEVGRGVDGATPVLSDQHGDMALVAEETKLYKIERAALSEEKDAEKKLIEGEKISNQSMQATAEP